MPEIKEYAPRVGVPGVTDIRRATSEDFGGQVGEGISRLGEQGAGFADSLQRAQTQQEISDIGAEIATAQAELSVEYQKQLTEGTLTVDEFSQQVRERTEAIGEDISTPEAKNYLNKASATVNGHFLGQAAVGQAQLAGAKTKSNFAKGLNASTTTLLNDPSSFNTTLKLQQDSISNLVAGGTLPAVKAEELRLETTNDLAKSAIQGWINLDPIAAKKQLQGGEWDRYLGTQDVTGAQVKAQMLGQTEQAIRAKDIEDERLIKQQEKILKKQQQDTQNDFLVRMDNKTLSTKDILASNLDPVGSGGKENFLEMLRRSSDDKMKTNSAVLIDLYSRIHLPATDPKALTDENDLNAYMGRGLTISDITSLRKEIQDKGTQAGDIESQLKKGVADIAKGKLTKSNPMTGFKDPIGDESYQRWLSTFLTKYNEGKKTGKTPQQMLTPGNPEYIGESSQFVRAPLDVMKDQVRSLQRPGAQPAGKPPVNVAPTTPRKPGETPAQYLKRIGK